MFSFIKGKIIHFIKALRLWLRALGLFWKHSPKMISYFIIQAIFSAFLPFVIIYVQARVVDEIAGARQINTLTQWVIIVLTSTALLQIISAIFKRIFEKYNRSWIINQNIFADAFLNMPYETMTKQETRTLYTKLEQMAMWSGLGLSDVWESFTMLISTGIRVIIAIIMSLGLFTSAAFNSNTLQHWFLSPYIGFAFILSLLVLSLLSPWLTGKAMRAFYALNETSTAGNRMFHWLFETMDVEKGMEVRIYNQGAFIRNIAFQDTGFSPGGAIDQAMHSTVGVLHTLAQTVAFLAVLLIYLYIVGVAYLGSITVGQVTQYIGVITELSSSISEYARGVVKIGAAEEVLTRIFELLDKAENSEVAVSNIENSDTLPRFNKEIRFENVNFAYPGTNRLVLENVNLTIKPDERLAIVGRNGSGKTTFIKLLCGLYKPDSGKILIDGVDLNSLALDAYRKLLGVVFQDSQLFAFSLGENIASEKNVDEAKAQRALTEAGIHLDDKNPFPNGLETAIGKELDETGITVSGGEAQKISIARALYRDSKLLILDEPTAALDPIAEAEIYKQINRVIKKEAVIFISHRLSSCRFSDRIAVFQDGQIIELGTHEDLLAKSGHYAELWHAQAQYYSEEEKEELIV